MDEISCIFRSKQQRSKACTRSLAGWGAKGGHVYSNMIGVLLVVHVNRSVPGLTVTEVNSVYCVHVNVVKHFHILLHAFGVWQVLISDPIREISLHILTSEVWICQTSTDFSS